MAWYDEAVFYHIYPLGLLGAPKTNDGGDPVPRLKDLRPWVDHIKRIGCTAIYIGPLFESGSHGYDTTDYRKLDRRLGTNDDLKDFVSYCHENEIKVVFDGVFNHVGRGFFAFQDLLKNRENSRYRDWFCDVNFSGNNEYNDGFSYGNWGGYNLLVRLNQRNPEVRDYIGDVIRFWVKEFDVDGLRLDTADVLDFDFMAFLRTVANDVKPDFWLMGEVIHGDYPRWVDARHLHSVTNYQLHKALYSGMNDHNFFEIAHTVRRYTNIEGGRMLGSRLYNFVDNHDVERIVSKLNKKEHFVPVYIMLYTLPGIPSIYYGSEFGIAGKKYRGGSDDAIRPALRLSDFPDALHRNPYTSLIAALGRVHENEKAFAYGDYTEHKLTTTEFAYARSLAGRTVFVTLSNADGGASFDLPAGDVSAYTGAIFGGTAAANDGRIHVEIPGNSGEIWIPSDGGAKVSENTIREMLQEIKKEEMKKAKAEAEKEAAIEKELGLVGTAAIPNKPYEEMTVEELQAVILAKMRKNGPVDDGMKRSVMENVYHDSLVNWAKSFR